MQDDGTDEVSTKDDALATVLIGGFAILAPGPLAGFFAAFSFVDRNSDHSE